MWKPPAKLQFVRSRARRDDALLHAELAGPDIEERAAQRAVREADADVRDAGPADDQVAKLGGDAIDRQRGIGERTQAREHRVGLIERERDVVLDIRRLGGELAPRHRIARVGRGAAAEQEERDARSDHDQRQEDQDAGGRGERAAPAFGRRRTRETLRIDLLG